MTANRKPLSNIQVFVLAWKIAGGSRDFFRSWDFWLALILLGVCYPTWSVQGWWLQPISVLPNLLGFTLGGFAIFLGFGNENFKEMIADKDELRSLYLSVSAAFLIFVAFQVAALLYALAAGALWIPTPQILRFADQFFIDFGNPFFWGVGYFLFLYSIVCSLRAALRIFRVSRWYNTFLVAESANKDATRAQDGS